MKDYPKPNIKVLFAPKLDKNVKAQIERSGKLKDPTTELRNIYIIYKNKSLTWPVPLHVYGQIFLIRMLLLIPRMLSYSCRVH